MQAIQIFSFAILIISIVIHEVSHGYVAYMQGDPTAYYEGRLSLNPFRHVDILGSIIVPVITTILGLPFGWAKPVPINIYNFRNERWGELFVALAGPGSNIAIAVFFGLLVRFFGGFLPQTFIILSLVIVLVNLGLAMFNLIPIPPLDGSKILFAIFPNRWLHYRRVIERYAFIVVLILIVTPMFSNFLGMLIGVGFKIITGVSLSAI
jgi:Zn-dependent protease